MIDNEKIVYNAVIETSSIYLKNDEILFKLILKANTHTPIVLHLSKSEKPLNSVLKELFYVTDTIDFKQLEGTYVRVTEQNGEIIRISNIITDKHFDIWERSFPKTPFWEGRKATF